MASGLDFRRLDREAALNFANAAAAMGVERIVYLGGLVPEGADSEHLRSRAESGEMLRSTGVPVTEIRAGIIVGAGSAAYSRNPRPRVPPAADGDAEVGAAQMLTRLIALQNLLYYLIRIADEPEAMGRVFDAGGPEYLTYEQMMLEFADEIAQAPAHPAGATADATAVILLAGAGDVGAGEYCARTDRRTEARYTRARRGIAGSRAAAAADVPRGRARRTGIRAAPPSAGALDRGRVSAPCLSSRSCVLRGKRAGGAAETCASPSQVWRVVTAIGGANRYYALDPLWWLRELIDWMGLGGPGFTHGRRDPVDPRVGDAIDYWTVLALEPERRLTLYFGMKAPGSGILEFELEALPGGGTRLTETAYWHPRRRSGAARRVIVLIPAHLFLFRVMTRSMVSLAEASGADLRGRNKRIGAVTRAVPASLAVIQTETSTARGVFSTVAAVMAPCSVKASGSFRRPPQLDVANCDFKSANSVGGPGSLTERPLTGTVAYSRCRPIAEVSPAGENRRKADLPR